MRLYYFFVSILFWLLIYAPGLLGQNISTEGKDFWFGFMENHEASQIDLEIFISSSDTTSGVVEMPFYNWSQSFQSFPGVTAKVTVPTSYAMSKGSGIIANRGVHVTSENTVSVYALNKRRLSSDATVVLPSISLGKEYYAMAHMEANGGGPSLFSEILIVAISDETELEITPSVYTTDGHIQNIPYQISLDQGQTYQLQSNQDLTGTYIQTINANQGDCKTFAVFGGNEWTRIGQCGGAQDNLYEQMFPINTWGKQFISIPYETRIGGDILKILASEDSTVVSINGGSPLTINKGQYRSVLIDKASYFEANKPISIGQFSRSQSCDQIEADPFFIILSPIEQRLKSVTFNALEIYRVNKYFLNVAIPTSGLSSIELDDVSISDQFDTVETNTNFAYAQIEIEAGNHTLECTEGFLAFVYGYGDIESFGYATGVSLQNLNLVVKSSDAGSGFIAEKDSTCIGDPLDFTVEADSVFIFFDWDFGDGNNASGKVVTHSFDKEGIYAVKVTANTSQGACSSEETSVKYINVVKPKIGIYGPRSVCPNVSQIEYKALGDYRNTYEWFVEGGTITTDRFSSSVKVDWGPTSSTASLKLLPRNYLGCYGDTLNLNIKVNVQLDPSIPFGADSLCSDVATGIAYETYLSNRSVYDWHVENGAVSNGQEEHAVTVSWHAPGTGRIWYEESSLDDDICSGWSDTLDIFIERAPDENIIVSIDERIHYNDDSVLINIVSDPAFQFYSWDFGDGYKIDSIPRNDDTLHIYACNDTYIINVSAYTNTVCQNIGEGLKAAEILPPSLEMVRVSNDTSSHLNVQIDWNYEGSNQYKQPIKLSRKQIFPKATDWELLTSFNTNSSTFIDKSRPSDSTIFLYKTHTNGACPEIVSSLEHNNLLLASYEFENDSSTSINWNDYINWNEGVDYYEVWRKTDDQAYVFLEKSITLEQIYPYDYDGFDFCYRVKAVEKSGNKAISWSNESCVDFVPSIKTYNFISPNEDKYNQFLTFDRIELYPNSVLTVFDRYGSKIKEFKNYKNDWDGKVSGKKLPTGTYYYALRLNESRNDQAFIKGFFSIMY